MESYETIIVGAGPAGLNCAEVLGKAGKKVLLLERNEEIGPKVCAGGLTGKSLEYFGIPDDLLDYKFKEITIHTPRQSRKVASDIVFAYTVDRKRFGQWQAEKLKKCNVDVRLKTRVKEIGTDYVVINNNEKIGFKYLVGADGSSSIVRSHLGIKITDLVIAVQYIIPTEKYKDFEMFFDAELFGLGYAWIFPHKGYASIGCGCDNKSLPAKKLREGFDKWLTRQNIDISKGEFQAHPINYDFRGCRFNNIFLAGDAAGLASGMTGEGIYQALISGEEAAKMIIDEKYVPVKLQEILRKKSVHNRALRFFERSGWLLKYEWEALAFLLKSQAFKKYLVNSFI